MTEQEIQLIKEQIHEALMPIGQVKVLKIDKERTTLLIIGENLSQMTNTNKILKATALSPHKIIDVVKNGHGYYLLVLKPERKKLTPFEEYLKQNGMDTDWADKIKRVIDLNKQNKDGGGMTDEEFKEYDELREEISNQIM